MRISRGWPSASDDTGPFSPSTNSISWNAPSTRRTTRMSCFANSLPPEYSSRKNASRYFASSSAHSSAVYRERKCKFDATRCQILRLKCTKFDFRWGSLQRSPIAPSLFLKGGRGEKEGNEEGKGREDEGEGRPQIFWPRTVPALGIHVPRTRYTSASSYSVKKLQRVQNNAARIVLEAPRRSHASPLLRTLHWLPVQQRID